MKSLIYLFQDFEFDVRNKGYDCMFLSCHARVSERNHTQYVPQCQGVPILLREPKAQTLGTMGYKQNAHEKDILQLSFR